MSDKRLGKVASVDLFIEDHGLLTLYVMLDFGGSTQGFGGFALDEWSKEDDRRVGTAAGLDLVLQLLALFGVNRLDEIKGRTVYALRDDKDGWNDPIAGLELPAFDGGRVFSVDAWRKRWYS